MIGTIEVRCSAHRPQMPLQPLFTFCGSPSSVRIMDVPKSIGTWSIDEVKLVVKYPDNSTTVKNAVRTGCVWVATIQGTDIAGKVSNGYEIVASGKDEDGNEVNGYVLGSGDVIVVNRDVNATKDIEKFYVKWNDELPTNPAKGDLVYHNSVFQMFNGSEWMKFGVDPTVIEGIEQEIAEVNAKIAEVSHKVTSEDGNQYINGEGEIWKKENGYTPWVARYVGYDPDPQAKIHWAGNDETGDGMWILLINGNQQLTNPNPISTDKTATHLEFKHNDDGQWHDMVADREAIEGQWTKKDDIATKSEAALAKSIATEAKGMADQVHDDIWASGGVKDEITTLQDTKASVDVTNVLRTDVEDCKEQIGKLFESKITEPENIAKGQILKVVEVQNTQGASLLGVSPLSNPTLQWEAVDPDVIPTKTSELENDSDFANKDFVNSSIATNTANFKGTFNNESEFPSEATNNDYLFWNTVDENGNTIYKRYKYVASTSTWTYEYTLNNSSFTAQQWATINGGPYASVGDIPTKTSQLQNDSDFTTKTYVDNAIGNVLTQEVF